MRRGRVLAIAVALLTSACSLRLHEPSPHLRPEWHHQPWQVHCETARSHAPAPGVAPGAHNAHWIWARDELDRAIHLRGDLEDGFLVVRGMVLDEETGVVVEPPTMDWLRARCLETMRRDDRDRLLELGRVTAARRGEHVEVAIVLPHRKLSSGSVRRVVVFGDSLSDTGLLKRRLRVMPGPPYWLGRFSNGPVWVDYVEAGFGFAVQNHSYGGAAITHHDPVAGEGLIRRIKEEGQHVLTGSIRHQVDDFLSGELVNGTIERADETVFAIWAGANEYISKEPIANVISTFLNSPAQEAGYERIADEAIAALEEQVHRLHAAGARRFVLIHLPDLGRTPIVLQNESYLPPSPIPTEAGRRLALSRRLSALTAYHNRALAGAVDRLRLALPDAEILEMDSSALMTAISENRLTLADGRSHDLGFRLEERAVLLSHEDVTRRFHRPCYTGNYLGSSDDDKVCPSEAGAVFWDVVHPTSYTHCWQAWFFKQTLAEAGWIEELPPPEAHREWCRAISERTVGIEESVWMFAID